MAIINGWGRGTWDEGAWGTALPVTLTGVSATAAIGGVGVNGNAVATVGGITATLGDVTVIAIADANVDVTGQEATSALGTIANIIGKQTTLMTSVATNQVGVNTTTATLVDTPIITADAIKQLQHATAIVLNKRTNIVNNINTRKGAIV